MFALLLSACLLPGCTKPGPASTTIAFVLDQHGNPADQAKTTVPFDVFPAPRSGVTLTAKAPGRGVSLFDLCAAYAGATGQRAAYSERVESKLRSQELKQPGPIELRPEELQLKFESTMLDAGFVIAPGLAGQKPVFEVLDRGFLRAREIRRHAYYLTADDAAVLGRHPAVVFTTVVKLPNLDVRRLAKAMRALNTDAGFQQQLPAGNSDSMVLVGFGTELATVRATLLAMDRAAEAGAEERRPLVEVVEIEHAKADDLVGILRVVFQPSPPGDGSQARSTLILSDDRTNSIVVRGTKAELARVKALIARLDVQPKAKK